MECLIIHNLSAGGRGSVTVRSEIERAARNVLQPIPDNELISSASLEYEPRFDQASGSGAMAYHQVQW